MSRDPKNWFRLVAFFLFVSIISTVATLETTLQIPKKGATSSQPLHAPLTAVPIFNVGAGVTVSTWQAESVFRRKMLQQAIQTLNMDSTGLPQSKPRSVHPIAPASSPSASSSMPVQAIQTVELDLGSGTAGPIQAIQTLSIVRQPQGEQQKSGLASPFEQPYFPGFAGDSGYSATPGECAWH